MQKNLNLSDVNVIALAKKEKKKLYDKEYRLANKEKIIEFRKKHYLGNKEKILKKCREYYILNTEKAKQISKNYYLNNKEKVAKASKEYYLNNIDHKRAYDAKYRAGRVEIYREQNKKYNKENRDKINKHLLNKYHTNTNFRLKNILRLRIVKVLKGTNKSTSTMKLLGCTIEKLWIHLEKKFTKGMTRGNHGLWHLDHIRPCASYDFNDPKQQAECFNYKNLQPLWAIDNMKKGAKY